MKQKGKKEETKKWGAKISAPTLKTQPKVESTKKKIYIFQSFQVSFKLQIFNSKISFPNFQFHILNAQILNSNLQFSKNPNLRFHDQNFKP